MTFLTAFLAFSSSDVSRVSEIALQFYLRNGTKTEDLGNDELGKSDLFMGNLAFVPDFDRPGTVDQWYDVTNGSGQVNVQVTFRASTVRCSLLITRPITSDVDFYPAGRINRCRSIASIS